MNFFKFFFVPDVLECSGMFHVPGFIDGPLLHVHQKFENKVEKDKKNLSIFNEVLANNISQSIASIS